MGPELRVELILLPAPNFAKSECLENGGRPVKRDDLSQIVDASRRHPY